MNLALLVVLIMVFALFGLVLAVIYWFLRYSFTTDQEKAELGQTDGQAHRLKNGQENRHSNDELRQHE